MACRYIYQDREYTKDEMIENLVNELFTSSQGMGVLRSIASKKSTSSSDFISTTVKMLNQRYMDAKNMLQAIKNSDASKEEKLKKTAIYKNIMEKTNQARKELLSTAIHKQLDYVFDQALADAKLVQSLYNSDTITFNELQFAANIVDTWSHINSALGIETEYSKDISEEDREKLLNILNTYRGLDGRTREIAIELISQSQKGGEISKEEIVKLVDTTIMTEYARELSTAGIPISNKLAYIIKEINYKINREHNENYGKIDKMFDKIKNNPIFKSQGWNLFIKVQKNKSGEETLGLNTRYSQKFWDNLRSVNYARRTKLDKADGDKSKIKAAWKEYNDWNEKNTIAFNALPFLQMDKYSDDDRNAEINRMKALGFNDSELNNIISESQKMYERFEHNKEFYEERLRYEIAESPEKIPTGMTEEEYIKEMMDEYDNLNNPLKYLSQKFTPGALVTAYGGARYSYLIAAKEINGQPTEYYDENFMKITQDKDLHEFYNWFVDFMKDNLDWLPQDEIEDLQSNFLPVIADRVAKEYGFTALKESVKGLGDWFMKALTANNYDQKIDLAAYSKKERRSFQARFINENVAIEDRSKDLVLMAKLFSDMALIYKHKNSVKAEVDTINYVLQNTKGSYKKNKLGELEATEKEATRIKSLADATVRSSFYGIKAQDELWKSDKLFYHWGELASLGLWKSEKAKKAQKITERIKELNKELETNEGLTDEEIEQKQAEIDLLKSEFYKLGGRAFSLTSAIDSSIGSTRMTSLGFAPFSAVRNLLVGKINNRIHAQGGRDFNKQDLIWANQNIISSSAKYWSAGKYETKMTKLLFGLMADSQLAEGEDGMYLKSMIDKNTTLDKFREMLPKAYTWLSSGDYHFKAEMLMAAMKHQKVKTSKGEVSFIDVFNEDRSYNSEEYGEWDAEANGGLSFDDFYSKNMLKYKQLANKLHGATGKDIYVKGKDSAIGRMLFLFKSWLPETVGVRFDPRHKDALLDRDEEGYYRTFLKIVREKRLGVIKTIIQTMFNRDNGITDELQLSNFKKAVKELQIIVSIWMAYMLLKAMAPDDDKKKKMYNLLVLRQLHDLRRDLTYYSDINSISDLQREIFPVIRTARNWEEAFRATAYYGLGIEKDNGEDMYDGDRTILKITKVLPIFSNINRVNYYMKGISDTGTRY